MKRCILAVSAICVLLVPAASRSWNQSEIEWLTISTEHFSIQYHPGLDRCAQRVAEIAETIYGPITSLYGYEPDGKIYFNIADVEDESQGSTYFYVNRIDMSAAPFDFWFRGSSSWLADVITHEFTHMISVQKSFKYPRRVPSLYVQAIGFEKEKRPDVINGYPNLQVSVPVPGELLPNWFAEGLAQYQCDAARHDIWDSHRDMLLRSAYLGKRLLTLDEMGVFSKTSLGAEMVYNQGFSMVRFIAERYGQDKLREMAANVSALKTWSFAGPCKRALGIDDRELHRLWKEDLAKKYDPVAARLAGRGIDGEKAAGKGFMNLFPLADGRRGGFYYLSNRGRDYVELDLVYHGPEGRERVLESGVSSRFALSPDGTTLCFSRKGRGNDHGYLRSDLYLYSIEREKTKRLTRGLRAANPAWSPDAKSIACSVTESGAHRIAIVDAETGSCRLVTPLVAGREYVGFSWGGRGILAARFDGTSRDIVLVDPASGSETVVLEGPADERDPFWDGEGAGFFYASDRSGIFNLYYHPMDGSGDLMLTDCLGGAFSPAAAGESVVYAGFGPDGFDIRNLASWRERGAAIDPSGDDARLLHERSSIAMGGLTSCRAPGAAVEGAEGLAAAPAAAENAAGFAGTPAAAVSFAKSFDIEYSKVFIYPRLMIFDGVPRIGVFLDSGDFLSRQNVFAGAAVNADGEFDLNLSVETRQFKPTFGLDVYRNRKRYEARGTLETGNAADLEIRYDLWDAYFWCSMELRPTTQFSRQEAVLQYNHGEYGVNMQIWELLDTREFRGEGGWNYYLANELSLLLHYKSIRAEIDADVNPRSGRSINLEATAAFDKLHSGDFAWAFKPVYDRDYFGRYLFNYDEYLPLPFWRHALSFHIQGGALDRSDINDFFYLYLGSRDGLRGYSYFSMGGRKTLMGRVTYRFPVWRNLNRQALHLYLGSLYAGVYAEAGKAWNEDTFDLDGAKKDVGFDLRLKGFSFYSYPIAASFEAAYALDDVVYRDPYNTFMTQYEQKKWKFYGSVLFSF